MRLSIYLSSLYVLCWAVLSLSVVSLCDPMDCSPLRLLCPWGFCRQEYWSGLPCPSPGDLPNPGIEPRSPALQADSLPSEPPGKSYFIHWWWFSRLCPTLVTRSTWSTCSHGAHVAHQYPLSMGFPRQEYWSGLPCPSPGDLPNPGIEPSSLSLHI